MVTLTKLQIPPDTPGPRPIRPVSETVIVSAVFTAILAAFPWPKIFETLEGAPLYDRTNYLEQIQYGHLTYDWFPYDSAIEFFTYEYLWGWALRQLADLGIPGEVILNSIAVAFLFMLSCTVTYYLPVHYLLLLVNPLVLTMAYSQSRSATMAMLLFLALVSFRRHKIIAILLVIVAAFVHTSTPLFVLLFFSAYYKPNSWGLPNSAIPPIIGGALVGLLTGPLMGEVLSILGDRRAEEYDMAAGWLFLSFWVYCLVFCILIWPRIGALLPARLAVAVFSLATFSIIFGGYPSRFISVFFACIVVTLAIDFVTYKRSALTLALFTGYLLVLWLLQFR